MGAIGGLPFQVVAQVQLIPDPAQPAIYALGIVNVVKVPGILRWTFSLAPNVGPASQGWAGVVQMNVDPSIPLAWARVMPLPWPPTAPPSDFQVDILDGAGATIPDNIASVIVRFDRVLPGAFGQT